MVKDNLWRIKGKYINNFKIENASFTKDKTVMLSCCANMGGDVLTRNIEILDKYAFKYRVDDSLVNVMGNIAKEDMLKNGPTITEVARSSASDIVGSKCVHGKWLELLQNCMGEFDEKRYLELRRERYFKEIKTCVKLGMQKRQMVAMARFYEQLVSKMPQSESKLRTDLAEHGKIKEEKTK